MDLGAAESRKVARITIDSVREDVQKVSWKVLDLEYKNLQTEMTFICNNGHQVKETWGKVRGRFECPTCIQDRKSKIRKGEVPPRDRSKRRVVALDQSTQITGYAVFDDKELIAYGTYSAAGGDARFRIMDTCNWIERIVELYQPDFVGIEDIQYNSWGGAGHNTFKLLGQLMGAIFRTLDGLKVSYDSVLIPTWRKSAGVRGSNRKEQKASAQRIVKGKYGLSVSEDEADAICIGLHYTKGRRLL